MTCPNRLDPSAVKIPPNGPHLGTESRRMTLTGIPRCETVARIYDISDLRPISTLLLSLPSRELSPPARMQTSQCAKSLLVSDSMFTHAAAASANEDTHILDSFAGEEAPTLASHGGATLRGALLLLVGRVPCKSELWKRRVA
ncbi:MAG: hypothetical protein O2960_24275 [Verrucomicrobia bacterium]|nr:hypothetical protein [Verrucomicrobiota bacterium]